MVMNAGQLPVNKVDRRNPKIVLVHNQKEVFEISNMHNDENFVLLEESSTARTS